MKRSGFERFKPAADTPKYRLIGRSAGEVGTGKTHFWLGAPGPIVVFSFDQGLEGVVEPFREHKDIYIAEYDWVPPPINDETDPDDRDKSKEEAIAIREKFTEDFEQAIQVARTVLLDKETDVWELFRYAEFGGPSDAPRNYPALNQRVRRLINMPKATDVNFGVIQGMGDEWASRATANGGTKGYSTGERIPKGFSEVDGLVHLTLLHRREGGTFFIDVGKARGPGGQDVQDQTFENVSFSDFAQLVFPGTEESDWV